MSKNPTKNINTVTKSPTTAPAPPIPKVISKPNPKGTGGGSGGGGGMKLAETTIANLKLETCKYCNRKFTMDRLGIHEKVCVENKSGKKQSNNKTNQRKIYDSAKHRLTGTVVESYLTKSKITSNEPRPINNWREQHLDLIKAVRAARALDEHIASGGNPADLPPPPPSDYSNYIQCPYCGRRFNEEAGGRHIPACKDMIHNKPGGGGGGTGTGGGGGNSFKSSQQNNKNQKKL